MLWALGLSGFLVNADNRAIAPILPAIANDFAVREAVVGLLISAFAIPYGLFQLVYGPIADKIGKIRTVLIALFLFAAAEFACSLADAFLPLFVLRVIAGTFAAGIIPVSLAYIGDSFAFAERAKAIAFFMSFSMSGQALSIVIGSMLAQYFSWKILFLSIGLLGMILSAWILRLQSGVVAPVVKEEISLKERYKQIFSNRRSRIVFFAVCLEGAILFGGFTYLGVYGNMFLGLGYFVTGLLTAGFSVAAFACSRFVSPVARKLGQHRMPLIGSTIITAAFLIIWLIPDWVGLFIGFLMLGWGFIFLHTALQTYATELFPEARGTCMSFFAFFLFFGNGIGPACLGVVYDIGGPRTMLAFTVFSMLAYTLFCQMAFRGFVRFTAQSK